MSAKSEVVSSRVSEIVVERGRSEQVLAEPIVLRMPWGSLLTRKPKRRGRPKVRKARQVAKAASRGRPAKVAAPKVGRPPVYTAAQRKQVAKALRKFGLTKGIKALRKEKLRVSLTLARSVAQEFGIEFVRGRPVAA